MSESGVVPLKTILLHAFNLFISTSALPAFCCVAFALSYWGKPIRVHLWRIVAFVVLFSVYTDITVNLMPTSFHLFNALAAYVLLFIILFRAEFHMKCLLRIMSTSYAAGLLQEVIFGGIGFMFISRQEYFTNPFLAMLVMWPPSLVLLGLAVRMRKNNPDGGPKILRYLSAPENKKLWPLFLFLFLQFFLLVLVFSHSFNPEQPIDLSLVFLMIAASGLSLVIIIFAIRWISRIRDDAVRMTQEVYIENVNRMFTTIRGQRHDFLNHVQVIQSFLKMKKYEPMERYVNEMVGEIGKINDLVGIGHPALSALIQAKLVTAEANRIRLSYSFTGMDKLSLGVKSVDIVKIMGNLIDNAIDEMMQYDQGERWVEVTGQSDAHDLWLTMRNPGRVIPEEEIKRLFSPGYTTKLDGKHSGLGLSVVKERVDYYNGSIAVDSSPGRDTSFTIRIPVSGKDIRLSEDQALQDLGEEGA